MNNPVLNLQGIAKSYNTGTPGEVNVLRGVDLSVAESEIVALVAPSGAGKSTLLHIAGLLDTPDAGTVAIGGDDMTGQSDSISQKSGQYRPGYKRQTIIRINYLPCLLNISVRSV